MRGNTKPGKSGYYGVYWHAGAQKWAVQIRVGQRLLYGGLYKEIADAAKAYDELAIRHKKQLFNFHINKGNFDG